MVSMQLHFRYKFGVLLVKTARPRRRISFPTTTTQQALTDSWRFLGTRSILRAMRAGQQDSTLKVNDFCMFLTLLSAASILTVRFLFSGGDSGEYTYTHTWKDFEITYHV